MAPAFCNNLNWNSHLTELSREILQFPDPESHNILYEELIKMFNADSKPPFLGFDFNYSAIPNYRYVENEIKNPEFVGVDVPSYFNYSSDSIDKKIIMIVGIDPKRSGEHLRKKISVGTPFGFNTGKVQPYWDFVQQLIDTNLTVYLTDTFKLYFKNVDTGSYKIRKFTNPEPDIHQHIFHEEIKFVKPDLIVTLGTIPRVWFSGLKKGRFSLKELRKISFQKDDPNHTLLYYSSGDRRIPILPLMHLSKRVPDRNMKMVEGYSVPNEKELIEKYVCLINKRVNC